MAGLNGVASPKKPSSHPAATQTESPLVGQLSYVTGNRVRIDDNIRYNPTSRLGHILGLQELDRKFPSDRVARELVTNDWCTLFADANLHETVAFTVPTAIDAIHIARLIRAH
jgi:hypothetical protein